MTQKDFFKKYPLKKKEYNAKYRKLHRDEILINSKKYYHKNKQKLMEKNKVYIQKNREKTLKDQKIWRLKVKYGLTINDFNKLLNKQGNACEICKIHFDNLNKPYIDHNHKTGKIRGLLCINCNSLLGHAKEDINILQNAIMYLIVLRGENERIRNS